MAAPRRREDAPQTAFIDACTDPVHGHSCGHELGLRPTLAEGSCSISSKGFPWTAFGTCWMCICRNLYRHVYPHVHAHVHWHLCGNVHGHAAAGQDAGQDREDMCLARETVRLFKLTCHCLEGSRRRQLQHICYRNTFESSKTNTSLLGGLSSQTAPTLTDRIHIGQRLIPVQVGHHGTTTRGKPQTN